MSANKISDKLTSRESIVFSDNKEENLIDIFLYKNRSKIESLPPLEKNVFLSLIELEYITHDQAELLLKEYEKSLIGILDLANNFGFVSNLNTTDLITSSVPTINLLTQEIDSRIIKRLHYNLVSNMHGLAFAVRDNVLQIALQDTDNIHALDIIRSFYPEYSEFKVYHATINDILRINDIYLNKSDSVDKILRELSDKENTYSAIDESTPIVKLVRTFLQDAVQSNASDIYFEPESSFVRIRYRIDGILRQVKVVDKQHWKNILVRIKVIANINITETRKPQDGKIDMVFVGRNIDFRVSTQPTIHGENVTIRVLDQKKNVFDLQTLGIEIDNLQKLMRILQKPNGLLVFTGPTGSGKTTTLYSIINYLNSIEKNIMTLEDPVEYNLPLVRQINIKESIGFTFEVGIRALLRQSPDVILIGEVRDEITARAVMRAVMTGHRVLTTLHTIDAAGAIQRLQDIGIGVGTIAGNVSAVISQRLVRKLCNKCKRPNTLNAHQIEALKIQSKDNRPIVVYEPHGCEHCGYSGYIGRVAAMEILEITDAMGDFIIKNPMRSAVTRFAESEGFVSLAIDLKRKILQGVTSIKEAQRVFNIF